MGGDCPQDKAWWEVEQEEGRQQGWEPQALRGSPGSLPPGPGRYPHPPKEDIGPADAEELGVLGSALAGGRDWSSIKQRGAVNCVLSCLQGAGERGNHPANPLLSKPEHPQGWDGEDAATLLHHLSSRHHLWFLQPPGDRPELETSGLLETPLQGNHIPCPQAGKGMRQPEAKRRCSWPGVMSATLPSSRGMWDDRSHISRDPQSPVQPAQSNALCAAWSDPAAGVSAGLSCASSGEIPSHGARLTCDTDAGVKSEALLVWLQEHVHGPTGAYSCWCGLRGFPLPAPTPLGLCSPSHPHRGPGCQGWEPGLWQGSDRLCRGCRAIIQSVEGVASPQPLSLHP